MSDDKRYERVIHLYEDVNAQSIKKVVEKIIDINTKDDKDSHNMIEYNREPIKLYISTNGGSVDDCFNLISIIKNSKTPIHSYVMGYAYSAGFFISIGCHKRFVGQYGELMYHQQTHGHWGNAEQTIYHADYMEKLRKKLRDYTIAHTKIPLNVLTEYDRIQKDWFISAQEAISLGVADEIV